MKKMTRLIRNAKINILLYRLWISKPCNKNTKWHDKITTFFKIKHSPSILMSLFGCLPDLDLFLDCYYKKQNGENRDEQKV